MRTRYFRLLAKYMVITIDEAAEILEISKQNVVALVRQKKITPLKNTSHGMLFLRSDIEQIKNTTMPSYERIVQKTPIFFDNTGTTNKSLQTFEEHINKLGELVAIYIYFNEVDAINDGFFMPSDTRSYGELIGLNNPHFIIVDNSGNELWLGGCNCGYLGEGPRGSESILQTLGFNEELINPILNYRVVKYFKDQESNNWDVIARNESVDSFDKDSAYADFYLYQDKLVLVQNFNDRIYRKANAGLLIEKYFNIIPEPVEVIFYDTNEQAKEYGYIALDNDGYEKSFNCIVKDISGKEFWLRPNIKPGNSLQIQTDVLNILEAYGVEVEPPKYYEKLINWFSRNVRNSLPETIVIKRKVNPTNFNNV